MTGWVRISGGTILGLIDVEGRVAELSGGALGGATLFGDTATAFFIRGSSPAWMGGIFDGDFTGVLADGTPLDIEVLGLGGIDPGKVRLIVDPYEAPSDALLKCAARKVDALGGGEVPRGLTR